MTDITTYPLEDWFETNLSQDWDWSVWTIYVNATPSFTFPAGVTTYIVVDPWKSTMQLAEIDDYDPDLKTIDVSNITLDKWAGVAYTQQPHQIGAKVRISHNYQFWKDMIDGINSKMNTNSDDLEVWKFADATARDAYRPTPVNWYSAYLIDVGYWTDYQSGNRVQRASWGSFSNATESISWGTEIWTTAEVTAWTAIWWTWASLSVTPEKLAAQIQSWSYISLANATDSGTDTYVTTATPTLTAYTTGQLFVVTFAETNTTTTPTLNIDWLWAVTITDKDSVALAVWDITTNKLILMKVWSAFKIMSELPATATKRWIDYKVSLWWTGSDWALSISSWTTTITWDWYIATKNYSSVTISSTAILTSNSKVTHINCLWNFTMSWWTIDCSWLAGNWGVSWWDGWNWFNQVLLQTYTWWGWNWEVWTWLAGTWVKPFFWKTWMCIWTWAWWGASEDYNWWSSAWWAGWWILIIEVGWTINFTSWTIKTNWANWWSPWGYAAAAGWGWWWGSIFIVGKTLTATSWTFESKWGTWWNSSETAASYDTWWGWWGWRGNWGACNTAWSAWLSVWVSWTVTWWAKWSGSDLPNGWWGWGWFIYVSQY